MNKEELLNFVKNNGGVATEEVDVAVGQLIEILEAQRKGSDDITKVLEWLEKKRESYGVRVREIGIKELDKWHADPRTGNISHESGKFFSIIGIKVEGAEGREVVSWTQPIIKQNECGILGILCKKINGVMHYLFYAQYQPGNIVNLQLSPTLQATNSNLTQAHGGRKPLFAEYFKNGKKGKVHASVVQVEDGGRFYLKTNRCMIVEVDEKEDINVPEDYIWLTLPQIKKLLKIDTTINALARCVLGSR